MDDLTLKLMVALAVEARGGLPYQCEPVHLALSTQLDYASKYTSGTPTPSMVAMWLDTALNNVGLHRRPPGA